MGGLQTVRFSESFAASHKWGHRGTARKPASCSPPWRNPQQSECKKGPGGPLSWWVLGSPSKKKKQQAPSIAA